MSRATYLCFFFLSAGISLLAGSEQRSATLDSILAPVLEKGGSETNQGRGEKVEKKTKRVSYRLVELSDVLTRMEQLLDSELKASSKLSLTSRFNWNGVKVREDLGWDIELKTPFSPNPRGRWYPTFEFLVDGAVISNYRIPIQVALFKEVWVLDQNVDRGASVASPATRAVVRDIYAERTAAIAVNQNLDHYEASRSLSKGRLLSWDDLEKRPHVRKNAIVDVEFNKGSLEIKMRGRAMDDGMLGELVTIRNLNTSREFVAQVRGENLVEFNL